AVHATPDRQHSGSRQGRGELRVHGRGQRRPIRAMTFLVRPEGKTMTRTIFDRRLTLRGIAWLFALPLLATAVPAGAQTDASAQNSIVVVHSNEPRSL